MALTMRINSPNSKKASCSNIFPPPELLLEGVFTIRDFSGKSRNNLAFTHFICVFQIFLVFSGVLGAIPLPKDANVLHLRILPFPAGKMQKNCTFPEKSWLFQKKIELI